MGVGVRLEILLFNDLIASISELLTQYKPPSLCRSTIAHDIPSQIKVTENSPRLTLT